MTKFLYRSYVAIGDSLTEGLGDTEFDADRHGKGWADRLSTLLACEAANANENFDYANLALRGSSSLAILTAQLETALEMRPDLVTIMTGANDLVRLPLRKRSIERLLRGAMMRLYAIGAHVVLVNTVRPTHLAMARVMVSRSAQMTALIERIAAEFGAPVVDLHGMHEFGRLDLWSGDFVHFSHRGHVAIANRVAETLGLDLRDNTDVEPGPTRMTVSDFGRWFLYDVIPFWVRRFRGVTAGTFLEPKQDGYVRLVSATTREWSDGASSIREVPQWETAATTARR